MPIHVAPEERCAAQHRDYPLTASRRCRSAARWRPPPDPSASATSRSTDLLPRFAISGRESCRDDRRTASSRAAPCRAVPDARAHCGPKAPRGRGAGRHRRRDEDEEATFHDAHTGVSHSRASPPTAISSRMTAKTRPNPERRRSGAAAARDMDGGTRGAMLAPRPPRSRNRHGGWWARKRRTCWRIRGTAQLVAATLDARVSAA